MTTKKKSAPARDEWTVRASDFDRLASAALRLRRACKDRLPVGQYDRVGGECFALDAILKPENEKP